MPNQELNHVSLEDGHATQDSQQLDEDGRIKRTGTTWTASAHIITAVIGSGVLSLSWAIAQLGWIVGPIMMLLFSAVTLLTSCLLSQAYRSGNPDTGTRNYTYTEAVRNILGGYNYELCAVTQYVNLLGSAMGYTITAALSMQSLQRSVCMHLRKSMDSCNVDNVNMHMIVFGIVEIFVSQIPDFHQLWWLSTVAAVMSFTYSTIGMVLGFVKVIENGRFKGTVGGTKVGLYLTQHQKMWRSIQSLGNIAFAYSFALVLVEIQDTVKSPPAESKTMKKAVKVSVAVTTVFYLLCGCFGYGAFGDSAPGNLLAGFGSFNPFWIVDVANVAIVVHLVGAYQVYSQPIFSFVELKAAQIFPTCKFVTHDIKVPIPCTKPYNLNFFTLLWRTIFVVVVTLISMMLPFFSDVVGLLGALGFWPLTVHFPVEMYIVQKKIPKFSFKGVVLRLLSLLCLLVTVLAAAGSIAGMVENLKTTKFFRI